jgi:hypothetical protein
MWVKYGHNRPHRKKLIAELCAHASAQPRATHHFRSWLPRVVPHSSSNIATIILIPPGKRIVCQNKINEKK